jgi:hypothetical protein
MYLLYVQYSFSSSNVIAWNCRSNLSTYPVIIGERIKSTVCIVLRIE